MSSFIAFIVPVIMLCVYVGINLYLSYGIYRGLRRFFPRLSPGFVIAFFLLMAVVLILGFVRSMLPIPSVLRNALGVVSSYWMGLFVYLLLFTLFSDIVYIMIKWFSPDFCLRAYFTLAAVVMALATSVYGVWHSNDFQHVTYDVTIASDEQMEDTKLVLISDLHLGAVGSENRLERIVQSINEVEPDIVCIAGDFFDNDFEAIRDPEKAVQVLKRLQTKHGVYACPGNHDSGKTVPEMLRFLEACNIRLLADEHVVIDNRFVLAGRVDPSPIGGFDGRKRAALETLLSEAPEDLPVIVMDHNPVSASTYGTEVSLVVSGHTHEGQVFPGALFTRILYDVDHGYWQKDSASPHVIVTSGVGTWGMPMRVGTDSEIVTINLQ